jgi:uncharacterized tellurite resistance protein B-like protein
MKYLGYVAATGKGRQDSTRYLAPIYRAAAAVIMMDGEIKTQEIHKAEVAGAEAFPGFDSTDFRQACDYVDDTPNPIMLADDLNDRLNPDQKSALVAYLKAIAEADGEVDWAEQDFIESVAAELGVSAA